jgi:hypothetical protein
VSVPARPLALLCAVGLCVFALCGCANTVQDEPIPHNLLEGLVVAPFPVYWLGASFHRMAVSETAHDPGDAYTINYGNCLEAGEEGACVSPLRVVTSPDNSFVPGGASAIGRARIRGVDALLERGGRTIVLPTAGVVVDIFASNARLAAAAARTAVAIGEPAVPESPLPAALPNTGFDEAPLPSQVPVPLRPVG